MCVAQGNDGKATRLRKWRQPLEYAGMNGARLGIYQRIVEVHTEQRKKETNQQLYSQKNKYALYYIVSSSKGHQKTSLEKE